MASDEATSAALNGDFGKAVMPTTEAMKFEPTRLSMSMQKLKTPDFVLTSARYQLPSRWPRAIHNLVSEGYSNDR